MVEQRIEEAIADFIRRYTIHPNTLWLSPWDLVRLLPSHWYAQDALQRASPEIFYKSCRIVLSHYSAVGLSVQLDSAESRARGREA